MTTNVNISSDFIHTGKKLRVRAVDPKDETKVYRELVFEHTPEMNSKNPCRCDTLYVHDGSKIIIEEVD